MKKTYYPLMILALLAGSLSACQASNEQTTPGEQGVNETITGQEANKTVTEQEAGKTIALKTRETLAIELDGNITTGFNWIPAPQDPALLEQVGEPEVTPKSDLPGAPGKIVLQFKAVAQGRQSCTWITSVHGRPM